MPIVANIMSGPRNSLISNIIWGIKKAFSLAVLLGVPAVLLRLLNGLDAFTRDGATLGSVLAVYFATAAVGGALAGVMRPHLHIALMSVLLGGIAGLTLGFSFHIMADGIGGWNGAGTITMILCLLCGLGSGFGIWYRMIPTKGL